MKAFKVNGPGVLEFVPVIPSRLAPTRSRPERTERPHLVDAVHRRRPEPAAMAPRLEELANQLMKKVFPAVTMQDEQDMLAVGALRVLVETDIGQELCPQSDGVLRSPVPFKIEADGPPTREVKPFTIGGGDRPAMLFAPNPPAAAAALLADPEQEPLVVDSRLYGSPSLTDVSDHC